MAATDSSYSEVLLDSLVAKNISGWQSQYISDGQSQYIRYWQSQ